MEFSKSTHDYIPIEKIKGIDFSTMMGGYSTILKFKLSNSNCNGHSCDMMQLY